MTRRYGRATRLFKARGSQLTPPSPAGSWPPQKPDLSKFTDRPKAPLGISSGYCPPDKFWHKDLQTCVPYNHEECEPPAYWSWQRWSDCLYTAYPHDCVGSSSGIRDMGTPQAISAGGCVPSPCDFNPDYPSYWSWSAFNCVPAGKPNEPYIAPGGISKRSTRSKIRRKGRRRRGRVSRRSRIRRRR